MNVRSEKGNLCKSLASTICSHSVTILCVVIEMWLDKMTKHSILMQQWIKPFHFFDLEVRFPFSKKVEHLHGVERQMTMILKDEY